ncbi:MAG: tetratricopeptide repeat protein [Pseudomonadota bacterium]
MQGSRLNGAIRVLIAAAISVCGALPTLAQDAPRIAFEDVLADPGNIDLNVAYARQQIAEGNLPGASATLERLLILAPDQNAVRLLYALVLLRLGQAEEALEEFQAVDPSTLSEADRQALGQYQAEAIRAQRTVTGSIALTGGFHFDTNRDGFPLGGDFQVELPGVGPTTITTDDDGTSDIGIFGIVNGTLDWTPPSQRIRRVRFEGTVLGVKQLDLDEFDVGSGFLGVSALVDATVADVLPFVSVRNINLGGDRYLTAAEGGLRVERAIGTDRRTIAFAEASGGYDDFESVEADEFAFEQSGPFVTAGFGVAHQPTDRLQLIGKYTFRRRMADQDFESFSSHGISGLAQIGISDGAVLQLSARYARVIFDDPDPFVSTTEEERDNAVSARIGVILEADELLRVAGVGNGGEVARNLSLNVGGSYRRVFSNLPNFEYQNFRFETSITKRFDF